MASAKKLPPFDVLLRFVEEDRLSYREIADKYGVTGEAVRQALDKGGYRKPNSRPSHAHYIPWKVRADHVGDVLARRLRAYSKRQQGKPLRDSEAKLLDEWLKFMDGENSLGVPLSVHYDRNTEDGFWLEVRQNGDRDLISPPLGA